ncbi:eukaryotic mitochondrial regulator protein-domain-containing protein [Syncephalis fuscata]|nr:eukaryotic mitochondrial regulator protein-domain-containing protein [Syncephalis fuscata]
MATPTATATKSASKQLRRAVNWLLNEGDKYKYMTPGQTNYVGMGRHPFPLNPAFRPNAPLTDKTRSEIFSLWYNNPAVWTPRQISNQYNISIKRAEAILRLKAYEARESAKNMVVQKHYVDGMEKMLGAQSKMVLSELPHEAIPHVGKPQYIAIGEETKFGPENAAKLLERLSYKKIKQSVDEKGRQSITLAQLQLEQNNKSSEAQVIAREPSLGNKRWQFMITDINRKVDVTKRQILVRDTDGTLREADSQERRQRAHKMSWY